MQELLKKRKITGLCIKSKRFIVGGRDCRLIVYPRGGVSIMLSACDSATSMYSVQNQCAGDFHGALLAAPCSPEGGVPVMVTRPACWRASALGVEHIGSISEGHSATVQRREYAIPSSAHQLAAGNIGSLY